MVDVTATALSAVFTTLTLPFAGLILRREFGATPLQLSLAASAGAAAMLLALAWARLAAHHPPLPWVVWPGVLGRGLFLLAPLAASAWALTALMSAATFVGTLAGPAQTALVERIYPRVVRGRAMAMVRAIAGVVAVGVSIAAGLVLETFGYRLAFAMAGGVGVVASLAFLAMRVPASDPPGGTARRTDRPTAVQHERAHGGAFTALMVSAFLFGTGCWIQVPARPLTLADVVRVTPSELGWLGAIGAVVTIGGSLVWGRLVDRRSSLHALRFVYVAGTASTVCYLTATTPWGLAWSFLGDGLVASGLEVVWIVALIDVAGPGRAARAAAVSATLAGVRGLTGPFAGALLIDAFGVGAVYVVAVGCMIAAFALLGRVARVRVASPIGEPVAVSLVR
ncbi:MAG: MFS transporter [Candidatus Rokubacteria bacterium]|nr:MFS transporter [Candidatus Rokubacteria bacterium]